MSDKDKDLKEIQKILGYFLLEEKLIMLMSREVLRKKNYMLILR